jgi:glutamate synthase domain-containing protein 2/glutamate synthase domain-containing protein 1/glutamate synthase domain-containing protein 3
MFNNVSDLEKSACGVGFIASRHNEHSHIHLRDALHALSCVEHRGACSADQITGDGAGIMTDIPFGMFGYEEGSVAVATLFMPLNIERQRIALQVFEETFAYLGLHIIEYRDVPVDLSVIGEEARKSLPAIKHAFIKRPEYCRTDASFDKLLHTAKQLTRTKEKEHGIVKEFYFTSLSSKTIVYKALTRSADLSRFYSDLTNPEFKTRFALFHRRFSTNTKSSWDKVQPFRLIGHNGEINTIAGNRSWALSREKYLGLPVDELLTHEGISDSGSLNEMVEALKYRSSIPHVEDILAIMMPPASRNSAFYKFWSRAMEPWDGPAFITYSDGHSIGARLDRNGFRPCRWVLTDNHFYLSSEAGSFIIEESSIQKKGSLQAGTGVKVDLDTGEVHFRDPSHSRENFDFQFDPRLEPIESLPADDDPAVLKKKFYFRYTDEDLDRLLIPMATEGKEPIGSMGDTARPAIFSDQPRSFFDYFYQNFAQVTNPPLDYLREEMVTDLHTYLGKKPNIFAPKELIPPNVAYELKSPVVDLGTMQYLFSLSSKNGSKTRIKAAVLDMLFRKSEGTVGFKSAIRNVMDSAVEAINRGCSILVISDRNADGENLPIPSLIMLRALVNELNDNGMRLRTTILVHSGEVISTHHISALIGFGATAVCPYMALNVVRQSDHRKMRDLPADEREKNLIKAYNHGLLKVMAKSGISVVRSYQSSKLFTALGIGKELKDLFFPGLYSPVGGIGIAELVEDIINHTQTASEIEESGKALKTYLYKEHNKGTEGEKHSMTNTRSKLIHELVRSTGYGLDDWKLYDAFLENGDITEPVNLRHLFTLKKAAKPTGNSIVQDRADILKTFGSGAMSFGAISAESQRDIFLAMREIGGRCNSGEGGENPYYFTEGITATAKQVASGRFGVTAEYLIVGDEIQIKIAQGAKPGEGGQLMGIKVDEHIARARHANPGVDLISPPPLHDIYSIEDLKELIYELKQLKPEARVNVKLVAGFNIGTIAAGVAKAGADIIHVSGGDGGTGAASLSSMKHAGLPWEIGLLEVHRSLVMHNLRHFVTLRTDGGLHTGKDIVMAAILGADEFEFGKLLLIAQGCVMARICEKNTCPTGIATHDPKFKAKYKGTKEDVVRMMNFLAEDVRKNLALIGEQNLSDLKGRIDLLNIHPARIPLIKKKKLDLSFFLTEISETGDKKFPKPAEFISELNAKIVRDTAEAVESEKDIALEYPITTNDRAAMATLCGELARKSHKKRRMAIDAREDSTVEFPYEGNIHIHFNGSAGQGFGVFLTAGLDVSLRGEANDSVCKSMSGGVVSISPPEGAGYVPEENTIIGNCALYGATGGKLFVNGVAGDRFAVRNSGATAVVEGAGLHACEYMTNGTIVILGAVSQNMGAGMTGGTIFLYGDQDRQINHEYICSVPLFSGDYDQLHTLLTEYLDRCGNGRAREIMENWENHKKMFRKFVPVGVAELSESNNKDIQNTMDTETVSA